MQLQARSRFSAASQVQQHATEMRTGLTMLGREVQQPEDDAPDSVASPGGDAGHMRRDSLNQRGQHITVSLQPGASQVCPALPGCQAPCNACLATSSGDHINQLSCCTGAQNVYANMAGNVLVHITAPALGLSSAQWSVVSWGQSQLARESVYDHKYIYRWGACYGS